jgi:hypothetical protein
VAFGPETSHGAANPLNLIRLVPAEGAGVSISSFVFCFGIARHADGCGGV